MTLNVESPRVYTRHGVPISVTGIAQVSKLDCISLHALSCISVECVAFVRLILECVVVKVSLPIDPWIAIPVRVVGDSKAKKFKGMYTLLNRNFLFKLFFNIKHFLFCRWKFRVRIKKCCTQLVSSFWGNHKRKYALLPWKHWWDSSLLIPAMLCH